MIPNPVKGPFWSKVIITAFVAIAIVNSYSSIIYFRLSMIPGFTLNNTIYKYLNPLLIISGVCFVIGYPIYWQFREKKREINTEKVFTWFIALIRYWLALEISGYGLSNHDFWGKPGALIKFAQILCVLATRTVKIYFSF